MLSQCLALVRPVGMSDENAEDWLSVAATDLKDVPPDLLAEACAAARRKCTHHGQIVPFIAEDVDPWIAQRRRMRAHLVEQGQPREESKQIDVEKPGSDDFRELLATLYKLNTNGKSRDRK